MKMVWGKFSIATAYDFSNWASVLRNWPIDPHVLKHFLVDILLTLVVGTHTYAESHNMFG